MVSCNYNGRYAVGGGVVAPFGGAKRDMPHDPMPPLQCPEQYGEVLARGAIGLKPLDQHVKDAAAGQRQ